MKTMKKALAALIALALMLCGAALAEETDTSGLLATVNGIAVPVDEALAEYEYYASIYRMYGYTEEDIAELKQSVADYYVELELIYQQFDAMGLEVDMEKVSAYAKEQYEAAVEGYTNYVDGDGMTDEALYKAAEELLNSDGYDMAYFDTYAYNEERLSAVLEHYANEIQITEEDVKAYYDELVAADQAMYESNPAYYEQADSYGERVLYVPEGFRTVKHILVMLSEENQDILADLEYQREQIEAALAGENADTETLNKQLADVSAQIDEVFASIDPRAQEIMDKLTAGEDFIALMDEYGEDPGMKSEPYASEGYKVWADSQSWVIPFRDGAMTLKQPGDISQPIRTSYGLHIIRYERDLASGPVPYETVRAELESEARDDALNSRFSELINQWRSEAVIELYIENLEPEQA